LPYNVTSGVVQALSILKHVRGVAKIEFGKEDIVRHKLVQRIVDAYEKYDESKKEEHKAVINKKPSK
jgi:phosphate starvation-inducible PhoH-like protein